MAFKALQNLNLINTQSVTPPSPALPPYTPPPTPSSFLLSLTLSSATFYLFYRL